MEDFKQAVTVIRRHNLYHVQCEKSWLLIKTGDNCTIVGIGELFEKNFRGVFPRNLRESILPIISLWCHQKQAQHQWYVNGEVPNNLWNIGCNETLNFTGRNSKKHYISYRVKTSTTCPARHLKLERWKREIKSKFKFIYIWKKKNQSGWKVTKLWLLKCFDEFRSLIGELKG